MQRGIDRRGQVFGRLTVLNEPPTKGSRSKLRTWKCRCECGTIKFVNPSLLRTGKTKSCGCLRRDMGKRKATHGLTDSPEWTAWARIKQVCSNPKNDYWKHYGGRGITICDRWKNSFEAFLQDMGRRPDGAKKHKRSFYSIDRIDNNGPYSPENCRWASASEQMNNTTRSRLITFRNETRTLTQWARMLGLDPNVVRHRLIYGWSVELALTTPH